MLDTKLRALERSLTEMSRRHETLRTTFGAEDGAPVQIIHPPTELKLQQLDLTAVSEEQREKEARRLMREEAVCPFDLVSGPLLRAKLLRMEPEKHLLLLTIHHIVFDGWSMVVLHHELFTLYGAFIQGHPSPLSELCIQYADFAVWQRQYLQGDVLAGQLGYWREQLRDLTTLDLPHRPPTPSDADIHRSNPRDSSSAKDHKGLELTRSARGGDTVHDNARSVSNLASSL